MAKIKIASSGWCSSWSEIEVELPDTATIIDTNFHTNVVDESVNTFPSESSHTMGRLCVIYRDK